jgi:RNA polymerase sigma factor (sigma-70 family)
MASRAETSVLRSIQMLFDGGIVSGHGDSQLLEEFLSRREGAADSAFTALLAAHGPMVWDLCRSVLGDDHEAEDAFQATFLVLVHRAAAIRRRDSIGPWLYGVARRVAVRAKATAPKRPLGEGRHVEMISTPVAEPERHEQIEALHEEVDRLAEKYRAAVVLCYFQGLTHREAARLLNCPVGTVSVRLSRARELLRSRLTRRGLALPAAWVAGTNLVESTKAAMPTGLAESTIKAAMRLANGEVMAGGVVSASVAKLTEAVLRAGMIPRMVVALAGVSAVGVFVAVFTFHARGLPSTQRTSRAAMVSPAAPQDEANGRDARFKETSKVRKPPVEFFGIRDRARVVVYAIDCSGSMATRNSLDVAKRELLASLGLLAPDSEFAVVFYNLEARVLADAGGRKGLMKPTGANTARVTAQIAEIQPLGGTDHMVALRAALALKPEVIFFLTDADLMTNGDVDEILREVGSTRIQAVQFGPGPKWRDVPPLSRFAATTGGTYMYKNVALFPRSNDEF